MKKHRLLSLILALVLLVSVLPLSALAATDLGKYESGHHTRYDHKYGYTDYNYHEYVFDSATHKGTVCVVDGKVISATGDFKNLVGTSVTVGGGGKDYYYTQHIHTYKFRSTRSGHGLACWCGSWQVMFSHDDPLTAEDGRCSCGYKYMDSTLINVLWMRNVSLSPRFTNDKYEYTGTLTKDVDEITLVTVKLNDELATLEEPESYKLKPGTNVFEFKVTAEDMKTTQTYTVTIEK